MFPRMSVRGTCCHTDPCADGKRLVISGLLVRTCTMGVYVVILLDMYTMHMVIDLQVLVKSFNCEGRSCYAGNPRESFLRVCERNVFIRQSFAKAGYYESYCIHIQLVKGCHSLHR